MKETIRWAAIGLVVTAAVVGVMLWWALGPEIRGRVNQEAALRGRGPVFGEEWDRISVGTTYSRSFNRGEFCPVANTQTYSTDKLALDGTLWMTSESGAGNYGSELRLEWGNVGLGITLEDRGGAFDQMRWHCWIKPDLGTVAMVSEDWYSDWMPSWLDEEYEEETIEWTYHITTTSSYLDRVEATNVHMGSDTGPTHSNERKFTDTWETVDDGEVQVTFGELSWSGGGYWDEETWRPAEIFPSSWVNVSHHIDWPDPAGEYARMTINSGEIPWNFSGIHDYGYTYRAAKMNVIGSGNTLTFQSDADGRPWPNHPRFSKSFRVPRQANWEKLVEALWGEREQREATEDLLVYGDFHKAEYMDGSFTWPQKDETDGGGSGDFAYGDAIPVRLGELHALGWYVKSVSPYGAWTVIGGYEHEFWQGTAMRLLIDRTSAKALNLPQFAGQYIIMGVPDLTATDCESDPRFPIAAAHGNVDVDLSGSLGERATPWKVDVVVVAAKGGTGPFNATGGQTLRREFADPWKARVQYHIDNYATWGPLLNAYLYRRNNTTPEGGWTLGWADDDAREDGGTGNDVVKWTDHRYLRIEMRDDSHLSGSVSVRVEYWIGTVSDNRIENARVASVTQGETQTVEYVGERNGNVVWVDLHGAAAETYDDIPELDHVAAVEIDLPAGGEWTFYGMDLAEHSNDDPGRDEVTPHAWVTFHERRDAYVSGGLQGVADGACKSTLSDNGNFNTAAGIRKYVEGICWHYTTDNDVSAAWGLEDYLRIATVATEGWEFGLPADWAARTVDVDEAVLTEGYSFDVDEAQDFGRLGEIDDEGYIHGRLAAYEWGTVAGIGYRPWGVLVQQGGIHGLSGMRGRAEIGKVYRRQTGETDWTEYATVSSDEDGYWSTSGDLIAAYDGDDPVWWEYRAGNGSYRQDFARLHRREWQWAYYGVSPDPHMCVGVAGGVWMAYCNDTGVAVVRRASPQKPWEQMAPAFTGGTEQHPCICCLPAHEILVCATLSGRTWIRRSRDWATSWVTLEGEDMLLNDLANGTIVQAHGIVYGVGYADGMAYAEISDTGGASKIVFAHGGTQTAIGACDDAQPTLQVMPTGEIIASLPRDGRMYTYKSGDFGETWTYLELLA